MGVQISLHFKTFVLKSYAKRENTVALENAIQNASTCLLLIVKVVNVVMISVLTQYIKHQCFIPYCLIIASRRKMYIAT